MYFVLGFVIGFGLFLCFRGWLSRIYIGALELVRKPDDKAPPKEDQPRDEEPAPIILPPVLPAPEEEEPEPYPSDDTFESLCRELYFTYSLKFDPSLQSDVEQKFKDLMVRVKKLIRYTDHLNKEPSKPETKPLRPPYM